jgi:hypothetical protein
MTRPPLDPDSLPRDHDLIAARLCLSRSFAAVAASAALLIAGPASADSLGRIEDAHRPPPSPSSPSSPSSSSKSSHHHADWGSLSSPSSSSSDESHGFPWACGIPGPWSGYCFYGLTWLRADRGSDPETLAPEVWHVALPVDPTEKDSRASDSPDLVDPREVPPPELPSEHVVVANLAPRYGELQASGFLGANHAIEGFDLRARAFLFVGGLDATWTHLVEPKSDSLTALNLFHFSTVGTLVAVRYVEAHVLAGLDLLYGHDVTPAFGPGLEIRTYPARSFTVGLSSRMSFFADGYPLVDTRLEMGLALGRMDVLFGGRWFFQAYQQQADVNILGPTLSLLLRLGP